MSEDKEPVRLVLKNIGHIPSKKNYHFPLKGGGLGIDKSVKDRMNRLENAILCELYFLCRTDVNETHLECLKQWRTRLSGLLDDSIREIPQGSWDVRYVEKGQEGVEIEITEL